MNNDLLFRFRFRLGSLSRDQSFLASGSSSRLDFLSRSLFGGSSTIPEMRRRGLQSALLHERMSYAAAQGCDLAMMVAVPGSNSHRNAERQGFRVAYTRTKWQRLP